MHMYMQRTHTHTHTHTHTYIHMHIYTYVCVCVYIYICKCGSFLSILNNQCTSVFTIKGFLTLWCSLFRIWGSLHIFFFYIDSFWRYGPDFLKEKKFVALSTFSVTSASRVCKCVCVCVCVCALHIHMHSLENICVYIRFGDIYTYIYTHIYPKLCIYICAHIRTYIP